MIILWGTKPYVSNTPINFYLSFNNNYYAIALTVVLNSSGVATNEGVVINVKSNNSCTYDSIGNKTVDWVAIGY